MMFQEKEEQSMNASVLSRRGNKILMRDKVWSRDWRKDHPESAQLGDPSHKVSWNPHTIADVNKCLLTGAWYNCLLRGSDREKRKRYNIWNANKENIFYSEKKLYIFKRSYLIKHSILLEFLKCIWYMCILNSNHCT